MRGAHRERRDLAEVRRRPEFALVSTGADMGMRGWCVRLRVVICVSLSTAAIALQPLTPTLLLLRLRARGDVDCKIAIVSMGADRKQALQGLAAYFRLTIFVLLRMAASATAPLLPISFSARL